MTSNTQKSEFEQKLHHYIECIEKTDTTFNLDDILGNSVYLNCFLKNKDLLKLLIRYLTVLHKDELINDITSYYKQNIPDDNTLDEYFFLNGEYTKVDLKKLKDNEVNEMLLFNVKKTNDSHFNEIFNTIKDYDIFEYKFPFDDNYLNARINSYKFNFLKKFYKTPKPEDYKDLIVRSKPKEKIVYSPEFGDAFILPYNFNNIAFKKAFFYLCSKQIDRPNDINLLNGFLNFESIFYSKNVIQNTEDSNLVTYIFFTAKNPKNEIEYIPNLRYTVDIPGDNIPSKIAYLKEYENQRQKFDEFDTKIVFDDKGVYFSTMNYKPEMIMLKILNYISFKKYDELLYYIFNSQFLSRSTCLFGYYIYFILTGKIPDKSVKNVYYDIIALTSTFETFKESLSFKEYKFPEKLSYITLSNLLDFVMEE